MSARASLLLSISSLAVALCNAGCDEALKRVSLIEETRVLGARVEVESDPSRGSPAPGEPATLRWFVVAPDGEPSFSYALAVCAAPLTNSGLPTCAGAPFASAERVEPSDDPARLDFTVPDELDLSATPHAFAHGLICPDSALTLALDGAASCVTGTGTDVAFEFALGGDEQNRNPSFAPDALTLDDEPWPASAAVACDDADLRRVTGKSRHRLQVALADSDFEWLTQPTSVDPARETLLVSPFANAGKLSNGFLSLAADTPIEERQVNWDAPALADDLPRLVRFYFVVRDARGGQDFTERRLCVVP